MSKKNKKELPKDVKPNFWDDWPRNLVGISPQGQPIPHHCNKCLEDPNRLFPIIMNTINEETNASYYGAKTKTWYCTKHWQEVWIDEIIL